MARAITSRTVMKLSWKFAGHGHNDLFAAAAYVPTLDTWLRAALPAS